MALLVLFHEHRLREYLDALRTYFLGSSADFTAALLSSLPTAGQAGRPLLSRRAGTLRRALEAALRLSGADEAGTIYAQEYASRLKLGADAKPNEEAARDAAAAAAAAIGGDSASAAEAVASAVAAAAAASAAATAAARARRILIHRIDA